MRIAWMWVVLVAPASAMAQVDGDRDAEAQLEFRAGRSAFSDERYEEALRHFERAYELSHREAMLYNIGEAADRVGDVERAIEAFEAYLGSETQERRGEVEARLRTLRRLQQERSRAPTPEETARADQANGSTVAPRDDGSSSRSLWWVGVIVGLVVVGAAVGLAVALSGRTNLGEPVQGDLQLSALMSWP